MKKTLNIPPGPKEPRFLGSMKHLSTDLPYYLLKLAREHHPFASFHIGKALCVLVNDPVWIEKILVKDASNFVKSRGFQRLKVLLGEGLFTSEGDFHLRQRRLSQKAFHKCRFEGYQNWMRLYAEEYRDTLKADQKRELSLDMMTLTLRVIGRTIFDKDLAKEAAGIGASLTEFLEYFPIRMFPGSELLDKVPIPATRHINHAKSELDKVIFKVIEERRKDPKDHGDLLSMLMAATDEEGDGTGMSDEHLRDEIMTTFLAGHETTANALCWTFYLLSCHPHVREKMQAEVDQVLEGRSPSFEDIPKLQYTKMVFAEAMRLYPPVWLIGRVAQEDYDLAGYEIPKGTTLYTCPLVTHNDVHYWEEPMAFRPERHSKEETKKRHRYAYFPFSGGQRLCMGERFAWVEAVTILATISREFEMHYEENRPANYSANLSLRPRHGMPMTVKAR